MKALVTFALLAFFAIAGEAATSAWDDFTLGSVSIMTALLSDAIPEPPSDEDDFTLIIVGPDLPPLPSLEESKTDLVRTGDTIPEPTSGLLLLVGAALLALRRRSSTGIFATHADCPRTQAGRFSIVA